MNDTKKDALGRQMRRGTLWQLIATSGEFGAKIIAMVVLARLLSPSDFGLASATLVVLSIVQVFGQLGVGSAIVQRSGLDDDHIRAAFAFSCGLGVVASVFVYMTAGYIASAFRMEALGQLLEVAAISIALAGVSIVAEALALKRLRFRLIALADAGSYFVGYVLVGTALALLEFGPWCLIAALIVQVGIRSIIFLIFSSHRKNPPYYPNKLASLLNYGAGFSIAQLGNYCAGQLDNFVVGRWLGADALGYYGRAYQLLMIPVQLIGKVADRVLFPSFSSIQSDERKTSEIFLIGSGLVALFSFHTAALLVLLAPEIILLSLGSQWISLTVPFQILCSVLACRTGSKVSDSLSRATGHVYRRAIRQWFYAAAIFCGAFLGHFYGLQGVSVGVATAMVVNYLLMLHLVSSVTGVIMELVLKQFLRQAFATLPFLLSIAFTSSFLREESFNNIIIVVSSLSVGLSVSLSILLLFTSFFGQEGIIIRRQLFSLLERR